MTELRAYRTGPVSTVGRWLVQLPSGATYPYPSAETAQRFADAHGGTVEPPTPREESDSQ